MKVFLSRSLSTSPSFSLYLCVCVYIYICIYTYTYTYIDLYIYVVQSLFMSLHGVVSMFGEVGGGGCCKEDTRPDLLQLLQGIFQRPTLQKLYLEPKSM